jgi:hypothetical protein
MTGGLTQAASVEFSVRPPVRSYSLKRSPFNFVFTSLI